jgi:putative heme-binding domain-containing protein
MKLPLTLFPDRIAVLAMVGLGWGAGTLPAQEPAGLDRAAYTAFALEHKGDAARGRVLYENGARSLCSQCHTLDGSGGKAGPGLSGIGDKFTRPDLIRAVLEPSAGIAIGYGTTVLTRKSGGSVAGVIKQATADELELTGADGVAVRVPLADIAGREELTVSLMPEGLQAAWTREEFADLIAWLETLKRAPDGTMVEIPQARRGVTFQPFLGQGKPFAEPSWFGQVPGREGQYVVLEHKGGSWIVDVGPAGETARRPLVDLRGRVRWGGGSGLLALAFHPDFEANRRYFLMYQIEEQGRISTRVEERLFDAAGAGDLGQAARLILNIPAATHDHNGGGLTFGPDRMLYIGMGDTGPQRDPQGHGQDRKQLPGKILRIDVDRQEGGLPYAIPADNPFRNQGGARPEIWALGFREPWRISFDPVTGDLWVGDVGQDRIEEVGIVRAGENHGWNVFEGHQAFSRQYRQDGIGYVPPVFSYPHSLGVSVTGGYVYRGPQAPALQGWYVFADFESRRVWALTQQERKLERIVELGRAPSRVVSFGQDRAGHLYTVGFDDGVIYRLGLEKVDLAPQRIRVLSPTAEAGPVPWRHTTVAPPEGWQRLEFGDQAWALTPGGYGTRGTPGGVIRTIWNRQDIWLRREFTCESAAAPDSRAAALTLRIHHDEDTEVYLNGIEIARLNRWTQGYITLPLPESASRALLPGRNVLSLHCRQHTGGQYIDAGLIQVIGPDTTE